MLYYLFNKGNLLLQKAEGDSHLSCNKQIYSYSIPNIFPLSFGEIPDERYCYTMPSHFLINGEEAMAFGMIGDLPNAGEHYEWVPLRTTWDYLPEHYYVAAAHASVWIYWEETNRFCSRCGTLLDRFMSMGKRCSKCGMEHFPHLAPAAIVRVTCGDKILLVRAKSFKRYMYGLVAGFLEGGETLEECAAREVMEETGLNIKNIRYFGSQPWPYPSGVMVGFTAEYAGGTITLRDGELIDAAFFDRDRLPPIPSSMSIARRLIDDFVLNN